MNLVLLRNTVQRLLSRPLALVLLLGYSLYLFGVLVKLNQLAPGMLDPGAASWTRTAGSAWVLVWILGTGLLGQERSDGYLPLLLSRPISRSTYVLSRWAGLVLSVIAVDLLLVLAAVAHLAVKGQAPDPLYVLQRVAWFGFFTVLTSSWLCLLSACFAGYGDLFYLVGASVVAYLLSMMTLGPAGLQQAHAVLAWFWEPGGASLDLVNQGLVNDAFLAGVGFTLAAAASLAGAAFVMTRRDISYVNR